jgi:Cys-rich repeat protein
VPVFVYRAEPRAMQKRAVRDGIRGLLLAAFVAAGCGDKHGEPRVTPREEDGGRDRADAAAVDARPDAVPGLAGVVVGSSCAVDADCPTGQCALDETITGTHYPGGYCTGRCNSDSDCGVRGLCVPGVLNRVGSCALRCDTDSDCMRDGYRCRAPGGVGRCAPGPKPLPDGVVGNACSTDDDCGGAPMSCTTKLGIGAPGGYCSQRCAVDSDCGEGGVCVSGVGIITVLAGICVKGCTPPAGCRPGYACNPVGGQSGEEKGVCTPDPSSSDGGQ